MCANVGVQMCVSVCIIASKKIRKLQFISMKILHVCG